MDNKNYYVSKSRKTKETMYLEYDKISGYEVTPKVNKKDQIEVSKIVFVNPEFSEKIIRKKIDKKIADLIKALKLIEEDDSGSDDDSAIKKTLMEAEKLKLQIINNYVKYLGHTYHSLTLEKITLIIDRLKYRLYILDEIKKMENVQSYTNERQGRSR